MAHTVFISYSSDDRAVAERICAALEKAHIGCWIAPRNIAGGVSYAKAILDAVHTSQVLVLVFSASANASPQVRREVERAVSRDIPILPLRIEELLPSGDMEFFLSAHHWLDAFPKLTDEHLQQLVRDVGALVAQQAGRGRTNGALRGGRIDRAEPPSAAGKAAPATPPKKPFQWLKALSPFARGRKFAKRIQEAIREVDGVVGELRALPGEVNVAGVCKVIRVAISHGAPIYNDGSHDGCAQIYRHAAGGIVAVLDGAGPLPEGLPFDAMATALAVLPRILDACPEVTEAIANQLAWALRHAFDRILAAAEAALLPQALQVVDGLLQREVPLDLGPAGDRIGAVLALTLQQGLVLYEAGSLKGFARLLLHTARGVRKQLDDPAAGDDALARLARQELDPILTPDVAVTDATAETLAGSLFSAFVRILQRQSEG